MGSSALLIMATPSSIIPEQTQVFVHTYTIQRDPRNFSSPSSFIPSRWFDRASKTPYELPNHNESAFIPFSYGPRSCVGKNLALLEMRILLAWLIQRFDMKAVGDGDVGFRQWEESLQDWFILQRKAPLWLKLVPRA